MRGKSLFDHRVHLGIGPGPGEYAINAPGMWHTADADEPVVALFVTVGKRTENRRR